MLSFRWQDDRSAIDSYQEIEREIGPYARRDFGESDLAEMVAVYLIGLGPLAAALFVIWKWSL